MAIKILPPEGALFIDDYRPSESKTSVPPESSINPLIRSTVAAITKNVKVKQYSGFWGKLGYFKEVTEQRVIGEKAVIVYPHFEDDKEAIQQELAPFFDEPKKITEDDVQAYIQALNEAYPEYAIDKNQDLLSEIRRTKGLMIESGERGFTRGVGLHAVFSENGRNTMVKIAHFQKNRDQMSQDIGYQREMLGSFKLFYGCKD